MRMSPVALELFLFGYGQFGSGLMVGAPLVFCQPEQGYSIFLANRLKIHFAGGIVGIDESRPEPCGVLCIRKSLGNLCHPIL